MKEHSLAYAVWLSIEKTPFEKIASLTVSGLARKFGVKPSYLSRSFRKYYYVTLRFHLEFKKFISFWIVVSHMKNPQVKKILAFMNIRNTSQFIRRFKKLYNITPGQVCRKERETHIKEGRNYFFYEDIENSIFITCQNTFKPCHSERIFLNRYEFFKFFYQKKT